MPYLIDGHNLIPKIPGLHLSDLDDELELVKILQQYSRLRRKQVECYFDHASPGHPRVRHYGQVVVKFARPDATADEEIRDRLKRLGKEARNWTVVSSDAGVQAAARAERAQFMTGEAFVQELRILLGSRPGGEEKASDALLSEEEVEYWLEVFDARKKKGKTAGRR